MKNLTLQLNVKNLANTSYYLGATSYWNVYPGAPQTFLASLRLEY